MSKQNYKSLFSAFIQEIKELPNSGFRDMENWSLSDDLENGVLIGYPISNSSERKLLHKIGQKFGLIPLCPHEVVDIEMGDNFVPKYAFVRTSYGNLKILPPKSR